MPVSTRTPLGLGGRVGKPGTGLRLGGVHDPLDLPAPTGFIARSVKFPVRHEPAAQVAH